MDYLYTLSIKHGYTDFRDASVHATVNSAFFKLYGYLRREVENGKLNRHVTEVDIQDLQNMDKDNLFDEYNRLTLFGRFRITRIKNLTTAKDAVDAVITTMDQRFEKLCSAVPAGATVCFPTELLTLEARQEWRDCDPVNADSVIKHLEHHIHLKINELSILHNIDVIRKDCAGSRYNPAFFPVSFNNSSSTSFFNIVVSPGGGY